MNRKRFYRWTLWGWLGLAGALLLNAGCDYEPDIDELEINAPAEETVIEAPKTSTEAIPTLTATTEATPDLLGTPDVTPQFQPLCVAAVLKLRPTAGVTETELTQMPPGTDVGWTGQSVPDATGLVDEAGNPIVWYEVRLEDGQTGWAASAYLNSGECPPTFVKNPIFGGNTWLSSSRHYGVDVSPGGTDSHLYSRYNDEVVAYDGCPDCPDNADHNSHNATDATALDYNYGYGAMTVVEYAYDDFTAEQLAELAANGITVGEGDSLYLMVAHLDPDEAHAEPGTALSAGDAVAMLGNSGNSDGLHGHVEAAVNESGLTLADDEAIVDYWYDDVVERDSKNPQGNRVDPTPIMTAPANP